MVHALSVELCTKSDAKNGRQYQKWVFAVSEILSEVKRIVTALIPSLLFRCFSLFLPHLRTLAVGKRSENRLRFGTGGPSLCLFFSPRWQWPLARKKNFWRSDLLTLSACTIGILSTLTCTEFDCADLLAML